MWILFSLAAPFKGVKGDFYVISTQEKVILEMGKVLFLKGNIVLLSLSNVIGKIYLKFI